MAVVKIRPGAHTWHKLFDLLRSMFEVNFFSSVRSATPSPNGGASYNRRVKHWSFRILRFLVSRAPQHGAHRRGRRGFRDSQR